MENREKATAITFACIGLALVIVLVIAPVLAPSNTNIFLTTENGGLPISCAPTNGFVLAQNLTDLCDVVIISPTTNQIIRYNGTFWVNVNSTLLETTVCTNNGHGDGNIVLSSTNGNCIFRGIANGQRIGISNNGTDTILTNLADCFSASTSGENICSVFSGLGLIVPKGLTKGTGINFISNSSDIQVINTLPENTVCNNSGSVGEGICVNNSVTLKKLLAGSNISLTSNGTRITIATSGLATESTVCTNNGHGAGNSIVSSSGGNCNFRGIASGTSITVTQNSTDIIITNSSPENTVCTNGGSIGEGLCIDGTVKIKSLVAGTGITLASNGTRVTITNSLPEVTVCTNLGHSPYSVCNGGNVSLRGIAQGSGITISQNSTDISIANSSPENTSCTNIGHSVYILCTASSNVSVKGLAQGTGITLSQNSTDVKIDNAYTCTSAGGTTLIKTSTTGSNCDLKGLTAGVGLTLTSNTNDNNYKTNFANGTGIQITGTTTQTFTNTGVISNSCSGAITCSGTNPSTFTFSGAVKICNVVASGGETTLTCTFSPTTFKSFLMQSSFTSTQADTWALRFNGDSGNNYNIRSSTNGGADATSGATGSYASVTITANQWYHYDWNCNEPLSTQEKHCYGSRQTSANGVANADARVEFASKWANTASVITDTELVRTAGTGTMTAGSFITVWGISQ